MDDKLKPATVLVNHPEDSAAVEAAQLRRTAGWYRSRGLTASATLFDNAAWIAEHGVSWMEYMRADGRTDDMELRS